MKRAVLQLVFLVLLLNFGKVVAQGTIFLSADFEGGVRPNGWTEQRISGTFYWGYKNGGGASSEPGLEDFRHPSASHAGNYNALFQVEGPGPASQLITPSMDLRFSIKPVLSFWLAQDVWDGSTDELRIYYRTSSASPWVLLDSYLATIMDWAYREIILPTEAKVEKCQLAFEAKSNYGWGICVDDVKVDERGNVPRTVNSVITLQVNDYLPTGTSQNPIAFIEVAVGGNTNTLYFTEANFNYTGTSISDLSSFKLYYTRDSVYSNNAPLPLTANVDGNNIKLSGGQQSLVTGLNYIWLCADIVNGATHGNKVDVTVPTNGLTIGGNNFPSTIQNPSGNCTIEQSIAAFDFETTAGWTLNNSWQIGVISGDGTNDPLTGFSGQKVLATNLTGNYPPEITVGAEHRATMNSVSAKYFQNVYIRYKRWLNVESTDKARVWYSIDGGSTWIKLMENALTIQDRFWQSISHDISNAATRKEDVMVRFAIDESDASVEYSGWNIDNFAITGDFIAKDLGVSGITSPVTHCGMTSTETVKVIIKNYGGADVTVPFEVGFSLDNGITYTKETVNTTVPFEGEIEYEFNPAKMNLLLPGLKQMKFKTFLAGDEDSKNDLFSTSLFVFPTYNYIFANSFEATNGYWNPSGTNSSWAWGIPAATKIDTASNGTKAWVTNLKGSHNNSEVSYLESPCFNFTSAEYPVFSFDYWVNTDLGVDGFRLDYSIDDGETWEIVPSHLSESQNWCSSSVTALSSIGWSGSTAIGYQTAKTLLPLDVLGVGKIVKFRFTFASNASTSLEGVSIDNIKIYELPYNVGIKRLISPISGCNIGNNVPIVARVTNGYRPLKAGFKVPIEVKLRSESIVKDTMVVGSLVISGDTTTLTTTKTYNIFTKGSHLLRINTNLTPELDRTNDTLKTTLQVKGIPGYSIGPDKAVTTLELAAGIELDAGLNGLVPYNSYKWSTTETTRKITVTSFDTYIDSVTNENGCIATDTIKVIESNSDIQILSVTGLDNSCEYPTPIKPQIAIKNLGPNPVGPSSSVTQTIPLSIMVDGIVKVSEVLTPGVDIAVNETVTYTFVNDIDISIPNTYDIRIYSKINEDPIKSNDTIKVTTNVWGMPNVELPFDTIVTYRADTLKLNARSGFASYKWQDNLPDPVDSIFNVTNLTSAWYRVIVTDTHACGSDKDSVYVNASDLRIISIDSPTPSFCKNENAHVSVLVSNSGRDVFTSDKVIHASYITPSENISQNFTLESNLSPGSSKTITFSNPVAMPEGDGFIKVTANIDIDPITSNNSIERTFEKREGPTVSFNPSTIYKVFGATPYTVSPIYSSNVKSYAWKDLYWTTIYTDSLFSIEGVPPGRSLHIIAYDDVNQTTGCKDTATLTIVSDDIAISEIKTPTNKCELEDNTSVKITIENKGNFTYPSGTVFTYSLDVDGTPSPDEAIPLTSDLLPNSQRDITLTNKANLALKTSSTVQVSISADLDVVASNSTLNKTVYSTGYPNVNLGVNRTVHAWSDTLKTVNKYQTYSWVLTGSGIIGTDTMLIATQTGNYKVNVIDFYGCPGTSNELTLTFVVDDIKLKTLDNPKTGCGLNATEPVRVTVENTGTEVIPSGKLLTIGFEQLNPSNAIVTSGSQNFNLGADLAVGQTQTFDLTGTMNFPDNIEYSAKAWVIMLGDMRSNNDTLQTTVKAYPAVLYVNGLGPDVQSETPYTLDAGAGFSYYKWGNSSGTLAEGINERTLLITTTGDYWVTVSNSDGCTATDNINVKIGTRDISVEALVAPITSCSLSASETITVKLKNTGTNIIPNATAIPIVLKVDGSTAATESCTLTSDLAIGASVDYTFTYKHNFSTIKTYPIEITTSLSDDEVSSNNTLFTSVTVKGNPLPSLGADRFISAPTILDAGAGYASYLWSTGATTQTITVSTSGTYSVTVTDANSCNGFDEVVLTWQEVSDIRVTALLSPSTNCYKAQGYPVTATLTNSGTRTFAPSDNITVWYQIDSNTPVEETRNIGSNFANGQTLNYTFTQKAILNPGAVSMVLKTIIGGVSGVPSATYPITINANPTVDITGSDTIRRSDAFVLTSTSSGGVTYLWNTGNTNSFISLAARAYGKYLLTVTNTLTGCTAKDSVVVDAPVSVETIPGSNAKVTFFPNPVNDELTITIETDKIEAFSIDLVNSAGQIVKNLTTDKTLLFSDKINVKGYTPGLYFIKVSNDKGTAVFKVIVQR
ncbi:MAG: T9SS C-terminal target domain-containing protein [Bacteroidales bacterium]|nr:MAG: T9SS C-terminal target domain-containing protein [Bacteroidales bacterium]